MKYTNSNTVRAIYTESDDNPYLAALPELMPKNIFLRRLQSLPAVPPDLLSLSGEERRRLLSGLANLFFPLDYMYTVYDLLYRAIQTTYHTKTVLDSIRQIGAVRQSGQTSFSTQAQSGSILGIPGAGKTSTVRRCLAQLPQVIEHREFQGQAFSCEADTFNRFSAPRAVSRSDNSIAPARTRAIFAQAGPTNSYNTDEARTIVINKLPIPAGRSLCAR